jgi:endonuclease YncB( thermonuclease family)
MEVCVQILRTVVAGAVAALQTFSATPRLHRSELVLVKSVISGDTISVTTFGRVRLLGIDAPKGSAGKDKMSGMILNRWIRLESESPTKDIHSSHLAYAVTEDGQCVNTVLVREGLARVSAAEALARFGELKRAEVDAQRFRRGMWVNTPPIPTPGYTRGSDATRSSAPKPSPTKKGTRKKKSP